MDSKLEILTPEAKAAVEKIARETGRSTETVLSELVLRAVKEWMSEIAEIRADRDKQEDVWNRFLAAGREHAKALPAGHTIDDSRQSAYSGRGE